jgi:hypothetical protein
VKAPKICKFLRKTYLWVLAAPILAIVLGAASNQAVLIANGDKFPVQLNQYEIDKFHARHNVSLEDVINEILGGGSKDIPLPPDMLDTVHCVMTKDTHLNALADVIDLGGDHLSVGDLFIQLGEWSWDFAPAIFLVLGVRKLNEASDESRAA